MTRPIARLTATNSIVIVVDIQDKLLAKMPTAESLVPSVGFLLDVANLLEVPVMATEQYPKGLGPTTDELARRLPANLTAKTAFSCCGAADFLTDLRTTKRANVVLVGMETHVCVAQTALDLLADGLSVFLPVDGIASRHPLDHETALRRLEAAGAIPTTVEAIAFEWVGDASHPSFKAISKLIIARDAAP